MPISLNEIKDRALQFSRNWADESREQAEAQTFWNEFFEVFDEDLHHLLNQGVDKEDVPILLDQLRYFVEG
jgi:hypothetical protein